MNPKPEIFFCEKCQNLVPKSEVSDVYRGLSLGKNRLHHVKSTTENFYQNQPSGTIGYLPVKKEILCGKVREPTDQEYFVAQVTS